MLRSSDLRVTGIVSIITYHEIWLGIISPGSFFLTIYAIHFVCKQISINVHSPGQLNFSDRYRIDIWLYIDTTMIRVVLQPGYPQT